MFVVVAAYSSKVLGIYSTLTSATEQVGIYYFNLFGELLNIKLSDNSDLDPYPFDGSFHLPTYDIICCGKIINVYDNFSDEVDYINSLFYAVTKIEYRLVDAFFRTPLFEKFFAESYKEKFYDHYLKSIKDYHEKAKYLCKNSVDQKTLNAFMEKFKTGFGKHISYPMLKVTEIGCDETIISYNFSEFANN